MEKLYVFIAMILAVLVPLSGCEMVDGYLDFSIVEFKEFLSISDAQKGDYLATEKLDFAKTGEVYFVPFAKAQPMRNTRSFFIPIGLLIPEMLEHIILSPQLTILWDMVL